MGVRCDWCKSRRADRPYERKAICEECFQKEKMNEDWDFCFEDKVYIFYDKYKKLKQENEGLNIQMSSLNEGSHLDELKIEERDRSLTLCREALNHVNKMDRQYYFDYEINIIRKAIKSINDILKKEKKS